MLQIRNNRFWSFLAVIKWMKFWLVILWWVVAYHLFCNHLSLYFVSSCGWVLTTQHFFKNEKIILFNISLSTKWYWYLNISITYTFFETAKTCINSSLKCFQLRITLNSWLPIYCDFIIGKTFWKNTHSHSHEIFGKYNLGNIFWFLFVGSLRNR